MIKTKLLLTVMAAGVACSSIADEVINNDLILRQSLCVGSECVDGEEFGFDTVRLKSDDPRLRFQDTSVSSFFPTNDWLMGIADDGAGGAPRFFVRDLDGGADVVILEGGSDGGVALGAGAELEYRGQRFA